MRIIEELIYGHAESYKNVVYPSNMTQRRADLLKSKVSYGDESIVKDAANITLTISENTIIMGKAYRLNEGIMPQVKDVKVFGEVSEILNDTGNLCQMVNTVFMLPRDFTSIAEEAELSEAYVSNHMTSNTNWDTINLSPEVLKYITYQCIIKRKNGVVGIRVPGNAQDYERYCLSAIVTILINLPEFLRKSICSFETNPIDKTTKVFFVPESKADNTAISLDGQSGYNIEYRGQYETISRMFDDASFSSFIKSIVELFSEQDDQILNINTIQNLEKIYEWQNCNQVDEGIIQSWESFIYENRNDTIIQTIFGEMIKILSSRGVLTDEYLGSELYDTSNVKIDNMLGLMRHKNLMQIMSSKGINVPWHSLENKCYVLVRGMDSEAVRRETDSLIASQGNYTKCFGTENYNSLYNLLNNICNKLEEDERIKREEQARLEAEELARREQQFRLEEEQRKREAEQKRKSSSEMKMKSGNKYKNENDIGFETDWEREEKARKNAEMRIKIQEQQRKESIQKGIFISVAIVAFVLIVIAVIFVFKHISEKNATPTDADYSSTEFSSEYTSEYTSEYQEDVTDEANDDLEDEDREDTDNTTETSDTSATTTDAVFDASALYNPINVKYFIEYCEKDFNSTISDNINQSIIDKIVYIDKDIDKGYEGESVTGKLEILLTYFVIRELNKDSYPAGIIVEECSYYKLDEYYVSVNKDNINPYFIKITYKQEGENEENPPKIMTLRFDGTDYSEYTENGYEEPDDESLIISSQFIDRINSYLENYKKTE